MFKFLFTHSLVISLLGCISIVLAETCPMLSDIVHKENNSYIYTAAGDWKRKAILFYLKNWKPINHGTVYSCGGEGLTVEDCPFKKNGH